MRMQRLGHRPALDGLRGVAILAVVLYHGGYAKGGFLGVDLFFVLSGFLITSLLLEERAETGRISLSGFYRRRVRRLLPVAFAGIAFGEVLLVGHGLLTGAQWRQSLAGPFALFYVENFAHFMHPPPISQLGHYWSLSEEEQFYLLWPLLLIWILRRRVSPRWLAAGLMAGAVAVMVHRGLLDSWWRLYGPDARADGLLLGCALAVIWKAGHLRLPSWVAPCCLAIFIADVLTLARSNAATYGVTVATVSGALVVGSLISNPDSRTARALAYRPLCWVGLISYSLYIWQPLVVSSSGVGGMPMLAISFVIAFGSYKLIEEPFRRRRRSQSAEPALRPAEALAGPVMESA